jgi:flagellar hook-associated protein 2
MAGISSPGIGSGLPVESIVTQLMELERRPLDRVESKQALVNAQISAYGSLKSKISSFQTAMEALSSISSFQIFQGSSSNESVFTASVDSDAVAGDYAINVLQLAERDKFAFGPYAAANTSLGGGTLSFSVGDESFDVSVGANATLSDIRNAINAKSDNTSISATLVTGDDGTRLVLSSRETGVDNAINIAVSGDSDGNDTDNAGLSSFTRMIGGTDYSTSISEAKDAMVEIDGFAVSSSSNTISDAVDGITFTAKSVGQSTLEVSRNDEDILAAVNKFAEAYNALRTEIKNQRNGQLEADSTLLTMEQALSNVFTSGSTITDSSFKYLIEVGVSINKSGVMEVDSDAVTNAMNTDFNSFVNLFAAEGQGYANKLEKLSDSWLADNGLIDAREVGLGQQKDRLEDDQIRLEARMELIETRIRAQYASLETLVSQLSSTGDYVQQQLAALSSSS